MINKKIILTTLVILSLFIFACGVQEDEPTPEVPTTPSEGSEPEESSEDEPKINDEDAENGEDLDDTELESQSQEKITREEIAQHNSAESCWVGYYGYVYDLTHWLNQHPGGADEILPHCGTVEEFTEAYDNRHGQKDELNRNTAIAELA